MAKKKKKAPAKKRTARARILKRKAPSKKRKAPVKIKFFPQKTTYYFPTSDPDVLLARDYDPLTGRHDERFVAVDEVHPKVHNEAYISALPGKAAIRSGKPPPRKVPRKVLV